MILVCVRPDYASSGRFFVNFTNPSGDTVVARFRRSANPLIADPGSRFDLCWGGGSAPCFIAQPFANHNGGNLAFGPDGFLYIGLGDGGSANDPGNRAQAPSELLGKMLRLDINVPDSDPSGYRIPPDNPFVSGGPAGTRLEIWAFGLRNPWRYSFDDPAHGGTGALIIADVGQGQWEEINYQSPMNGGGRNYGWRYREGAHDYITSNPPAFLPLTEPIYEYSHSVGFSITGGYVYRGRGLGHAYRRRYFFADFSTGRVWSLGLAINSATGNASATDIIEHTAELGGSALGTVSSFGVDADGELYIVAYTAGRIVKVLGHPDAVPGDFTGDFKADVGVFRPSTGAWYVSGLGATTFGGYGDMPVIGDYDGDGRMDIAIFRPSTGAWYIVNSSNGSGVVYTWGGRGDVPVPGDYDGDGKADIAVFRPSSGAWYIVRSKTQTGVAFVWGGGGDVAVPGDYDGDGITDIAVFRPSNGTWYIVWSKTQIGVGFVWGGSGDVAVPGDYDGDGIADIAVFRPSSSTWYVARSATMTVTSMVWGGSGDIPVAADYDGDGKTDVAVFRPSTGTWSIANSGGGMSTFIFGGAGDIPVIK